MSIDYEDVFPDGRAFTYEGDRPYGFLLAMTALGLPVSLTVVVPPERIDDFLAEAGEDTEDKFQVAT